MVGGCTKGRGEVGMAKSEQHFFSNGFPCNLPSLQYICQVEEMLSVCLSKYRDNPDMGEELVRETGHLQIKG